MSFAAGHTEATIERSGWVSAVRHAGSPLSYLAGAALGDLIVDGQVLGPVQPEVRADVDEVEFVYTYPGRLQIVVRHTFSAGWSLRVAFSSLAATAQTVERAELRLEPQPGCVAWALTLGATGAYSVVPAVSPGESSKPGSAPLLGGLLRLGSLDRATTGGLDLSPFELRGDARYVVQLHWDWYASPRVFARERYPDAPSALFLTAGEPVQIHVDEDVALLAPAGVETTEGAGHLEVLSEVSGIFGFELRSARGTTIFDLQWVDPVEESIRQRVSEAMSQPSTAAGVVKLASVAEALVVQHALVTNGVDDPDQAAEALDLFTARLRGDRPITPLETAYLCREYDRLGDIELLEQATEAVLAQPGPRPGLGLAATQLCLGLIVSGQPVDTVLNHLSELVDSIAADHDRRSGVSVRAAELELISVTHAGPGAAGSTAGRVDVSSRAASLGVQLGAGLQGRAVDPPPTAELSHLITIFQLLPDSVSAALGRQWGCSAHTLAQRATPELLARMALEPVSEAHAWLVLALQTS